jgi:hypothetical protein
MLSKRKEEKTVEQLTENLTDMDKEISKKNEKLRIQKQRQKQKRKEKECTTEVYAIKQKRQSFSSPQKTYVRSGHQKHSGDNTVPYVSLSYAKNWLSDDTNRNKREKGEKSEKSELSDSKGENNKNGEKGDRIWDEHRPEVTHKNLFDTWASLKMASSISTVDPAVDIFHSEHDNGDTTVVSVRVSFCVSVRVSVRVRVREGKASKPLTPIRIKIQIQIPTLTLTQTLRSWKSLGWII